MTAPRLLAVGPGHAAVLAALHGRCFDDAWDEAALARLLALPTTFGFVAGVRPPRGFVLATAAGGDAEILTLCTDPAARRRGLGRRLMAAALAHLAAHGGGRLFLEVAADNGAARALYAGLGFDAVGRRRDYYGPGRDALVLARPASAGLLHP